MPRYARAVVAGCAHHITQRGNHRARVFESDDDRHVYLALVKASTQDCGVTLLGYCLMPNHVHWIATPESEDALAAAFGRAHQRYSLYFQARQGMTGHLWQNRYYSCPLSTGHLLAAMRYVEQNPVRAGFAGGAEHYSWSSAVAHLTGWDERGLLDVAAWTAMCPPAEWRDTLAVATDSLVRDELERCTYTGRPCGGDSFRAAVGMHLRRDLTLRRPGRPRKRDVLAAKMGNC
jgi:putative transposase